MIHLEHHDHVAVLRFEHGKANAVDAVFFADLSQGIVEAREAGARALVLTGSGAMFSAGVDLRQVVEGGSEYVHKFLPSLSNGLLEVFSLDMPVVAAVNGHALAGGCILAAACDLRLMAEGRGKIGVTELLVGVPFPAAALETWRYLVPAHRAQELVLRGRALGPEEALAAGVVDDVVAADELQERAIAEARKLARIPRDAFALTKEQLRRHVLERLAAHGEADDARVAEFWSRPETMERIRAFMAQAMGKKKG